MRKAALALVLTALCLPLPAAAQPAATPAAEAFALFFHPDLEAGQPIAETLRRAEILTAR